MVTNKLTIEARVTEGVVVAGIAWSMSRGNKMSRRRRTIDWDRVLSARSKVRRAQVAHASWALQV